MFANFELQVHKENRLSRRQTNDTWFYIQNIKRTILYFEWKLKKASSKILKGSLEKPKNCLEAIFPKISTCRWKIQEIDFFSKIEDVS